MSLHLSVPLLSAGDELGIPVSTVLQLVRNRDQRKTAVDVAEVPLLFDSVTDIELTALTFP